jgi:maltose alpha-D-glucosyltransferase/alpha-amylase
MTAIRRRMQVFGRGSLDFLQPDNRKVLAFHRLYQDSSALVIANLSRFAQAATLDLSCFDGLTPLEVFGRTVFPVITSQPYMVTLGPYAFFWLSLGQRRKSLEAINTSAPPVETAPLEIASLYDVFDAGGLDVLTRALPGSLQSRRWFQGRGRTIDTIRCVDVIRIRPTWSSILIIRVDYTEGDADTYSILATLATGEHAEQVRATLPESSFQVRDAEGNTGVLYSSIHDPDFAQALFEAIGRRRRFRTASCELAGIRARAFDELDRSESAPKVLTGGSANNSIVFGRSAVLKLFRRLEPGVSPEPEMSAFLANHGFHHIAPVAGVLQYRSMDSDPITLGILNQFIPHEATAWDYTLDSLAAFFEKSKLKEPDALAGSYLEMARLLGQRTGEFHTALGASRIDPAFAPEPFTDFYRIGMYHGLLARATRAFVALRDRGSDLPIPPAGLVDLEDKVRTVLLPFRGRRFHGMRIRQHGHYHLGQVLFTGKDFVIIDLEGDPRRHFSDRRTKRCPLRDVASMLFSLRFASIAAAFGLVPGVQPHEEDQASIEKWGTLWYEKVSESFLQGYLTAMSASGLLPSSEDEIAFILKILKIEEGLTRIQQEVSEEGSKLLTVSLRMLQETVA